MKKIVLPFLAVLALASSAFAGHEMKESKEYKAVPPEPCFKDQELQLDLFASWTDATNNNPHEDGWGGGIGVNYFFMKYVGIGVDGNVYDGGPAVWDFTARIIARYPIEGAICIAPYAFAGGGLLFDDTTVGTWHVGGGLEWRATHTIGVFAEGRYTWGGADVEATQIRGGVRFVF
jgi:opacity protein-like surface antigen